MHAQEAYDWDEAVRLGRELTGFINRRRRGDDPMFYHARELDCSFNGLPTLSVEVTGSEGRIAYYKCNVTLIGGEGLPLLVFSPLVVTWEKGKGERGSGLGRPIIDHSVSSIAGFCEARAAQISGALVASGNLTEAKSGRPFFEALNWEIAGPGDLNRYGGALAKAMAYIAAQIEAAIAPLALSPGEVAIPISFALLRLGQFGQRGSAKRLEVDTLLDADLRI